jgi:hypothetical protein
MSFVGGQIAWRLPIACQMLFAFVRFSTPNPTFNFSLVVQVVIFLVFGVPESPRYCYQKGRNEEALQILSDVYGVPKDDPKIQAEQTEILDALAIEMKHGEYKWRNILKRDEVATGRRVYVSPFSLSNYEESCTGGG